MSKKSATNAAPIWLLKMVKRSLANNDFYANNVAPDLVRNTTLLSGLKPFSKNTFLANRLLNSSQLSMINHLKPLRNISIVIEPSSLTAWLPARL